MVLENLALRQQLASLVAKKRKPCITGFDRWFWVMLRRFWSRWTEALIIVKPEAVVSWHRAGFRRYWTWLSRRRSGRPGVDLILSSLRQSLTRVGSWVARVRTKCRVK
jgi:hypothetical protein